MEIWVDISGFEGYYQVSNLGNIRSVTRKVKTKHAFRTVPGQPLVKMVAFNGYHAVQLRKRIKKTCCFVHRLVASHFIENPSGLPIVNHLDMDKQNNRVENLEWTDKSGNAFHAISHGRWNMKNRVA